ncbi:MAG TPA: phosphate ABC transporter substrate-binding protein PstS [Candidatus Saccharimonadales bacterium]|nr:phosphate ABC transporter substrate-binding protein PstS [Candidatus Saccharimonadales bacterium]
MTRTLKLIVCTALLCVSASAQSLNGAGATFPNPIYQKWFSQFSSSHSGVQINYQSLGSGAGIHQLIAGTVDFGASDGPMTDEQISQYKGKVLHIPTVLGAVVPAYNIPGVKQELKFTPELLAGMFLGKINNWNDPAIAKVNPGVRFPSQSIVIVHRSDGSGTTYIFTDYLSKVSPEWNSSVGKGTSVKWPVGLGGKGNEGVAGTIRQIEGAIGYVELIYAVQNNISYGVVRNKSGNYVKASLESTTAAAAAAAAKMPADYRVSITNPDGKNAYPIASFTWLLVPQQSRDAKKGKVLHDFLDWMLKHGQSETSTLTYAPLPKEVAQKLEATISTIH